MKLPKFDDPWKCVLKGPAKNKAYRKGLKWFWEQHDIHDVKLLDGKSRKICKQCGEFYG